MKAIAIVPGTTELRLVERPEPAVAAPDDVKLKVLRVGICGTDREEASGGRADAPEGRSDLVIGHEMIGQVVEAGSSVTRVRKGDYCVLTVRRGCGKCKACLMHRSDMCNTGQYRERGIKGLDGYETEFVVDSETYAVHVPDDLGTVGVLTEPLSIAEKAIDEAVRVQSARLPEDPATGLRLDGKRCLVAGLGPVGLLAAMALRLRGAEVYGIDIVDAGTARPKWMEYIGGRYVDGREVTPDLVEKKMGLMDLIFEATGIAALEFNLLDALGPNGIYVLTGIPGGDRPIQIQGADLVRRLVLGNQVMIGSVNASRHHFQMAVNDLQDSKLRWNDHVDRLITDRHNYSEFKDALSHHGADEIKVVIEWNSEEKTA
jgi:threonine dehydrogenase-like Zn-dependent dehydrogenase